jgi:three-Cys-motif partner protein
MTSYKTDGTVGPWAQEKLDCLGKYLTEYTKIMRNQTWCRGYYYIDAFAGAGIAPLRAYSASEPNAGQLAFTNLESEEEITQYVLGSPHVALGIDHPFTEYFFIDLSNSNTDNLHSLENKYGDSRNINVRTGDANNAVRQIIDDLGLLTRKDQRGFVFLDPFGMQVHWETIEYIASTTS